MNHPKPSNGEAVGGGLPCPRPLGAAAQPPDDEVARLERDLRERVRSLAPLFAALAPLDDRFEAFRRAIDDMVGVLSATSPHTQEGRAARLRIRDAFSDVAAAMIDLHGAAVGARTSGD